MVVRYTCRGKLCPRLLSAAVLPVAALLIVLAGLRKASWIASLAGLATAAVVAIWALWNAGFTGRERVSPMALRRDCFRSAGWCFPPFCFTTLPSQRASLDTGESLGRQSDGRSALAGPVDCFYSGAFIEGAAGFGTPAAAAGVMLTGLGFKTILCAATICLLANTGACGVSAPSALHSSCWPPSPASLCCN